MMKSIFFILFITGNSSCVYSVPSQSEENNQLEIDNNEGLNKQEEQSDPGLRSRFSYLNKDLFSDDVPEGYVQDKNALPQERN